MYYVIICSTTREIEPFLKAKQAKEIGADELYSYATPEYDRVDIVISGAGILPLTYRYTRYLSAFSRPDMAIQVGIAGSFDESLTPGTLLEVASEVLTDYGAEERNGTLLNMFDMGLWKYDAFPFNKLGEIENPQCIFEDLPKVKSATVNLSTGTEQTIGRIRGKYDVQTENMEGAAFFYVSLLQKVKFAQLRAISNKVEPRNKEAWQIDKAIKALNDYLIEFMP
jgi:futalosine hydrolase